MRMVAADGRGFAGSKPAKVENNASAAPEKADRRSLWLALSYVFLVVGGVFGLHRLYNRQPVLAFGQALFSVYVFLDFGSHTSVFLGILLIGWLIYDAVMIPKWIAARAEQ
jgi:hypothetical protein